MDDAYVTAASVLALTLHSLPGDSPAKARRLRAQAWLEAAGVHPGPPLTLTLSFLCPWSPCHAAVAIALQAEPAAAAGAPALALRPAPCALCSGGRAALAAVCEALNAVAPRPELSNLPGLLTRSIERSARAIWPQAAAAAAASLRPPPLLLPPPARAAVEDALEGAVAALQAHPLAAPHGALEGLALALSLLVCAKGCAKAALICRPLPPWLMAAASGGGGGGGGSSSGGGGDGPFAQQSEADLGALGAAVAGLPRAAALAAAWPACLRALPPDALLLLHWLACLAPVHLVRAAAPRAPGVTASFLALHGPPCATAAQRGAPGSLPLWAAGEARALGALGASRHPPHRLFHGSSTDSAYAILHFGLRSLSGTRHESSGAIFGAGVYLTGALGVAREFAARRGGAWGGYACSSAGLGGGAAAGASAGAGSGGSGSGSGSGGAFSPLLPAPTTSTNATTLRAIFEVELIRAPSVSYILEGKRVAAGGGEWLPPAAAYIVVPNAAHLHITELHIVSDAVGEGGAAAAASAAAAAPAAAPAPAPRAPAPAPALGREGAARGQCCAPWATWAAAALLLAFVAYKLGALRLVSGGAGGGEGPWGQGRDDDVF